jgi:hypothetical protein
VRQAELAPPPARFARRNYVEFEGHQTILPAVPCIALQPDDSSGSAS